MFFPWQQVQHIPTNTQTQRSSAVTTYSISMHLYFGQWLLFVQCSDGIWGFLCFIPSLSCYCILSIVSIKDLLSLACHTSWPAAKEVLGKESSPCHEPNLTDSQACLYYLYCLTHFISVFNLFSLCVSSFVWTGTTWWNCWRNLEKWNSLTSCSISLGL